MTLKIDENGRISGLVIGEDKHFFLLNGRSSLSQFTETDAVRTIKLPGGGYEFIRTATNSNGVPCTITDRFFPTKDSIRWEVDIYSQADSFTVPVAAILHWPAGEGTRFWTAWSDPDMIGTGGWDTAAMKAEGWRDPLETRRFYDALRWYGGNPAEMVPSSGDYFSIPLCTVIESDSGIGFSFIQSPEDTLIYMKLQTAADGTMAFQHLHHRLGDGGHVKFSMDLVSHPADWRSGLKWMVERYPECFKPVNPKAYEMAGCGAYSSWEGDLDVPKLKKMAFKFNWKASFDFPYMGMFLPPVDEWQSFATYEEATKDPWVTGEYKGQAMSINQLQQYCKKMNDYGFYVLNYFNVTEFGTKVGAADKVHTDIAKKDHWRNSTDFLHTQIADGIVYDDKGGHYRTWGDAVVMDCGAQNYQAFLLEQAQRHIDKIPASSGICIDRLDWLRYFNTRANDHVSWYEDRPARSLIISWKDLMSKLGPLMHNNNKIIFANPMVMMRIDILRQIDGIYSEHNETGPALNASSLLGVGKPVIAWTWNEDSLRPHPDAFFQKLLYLGVFPTAPVPYNNHTIMPSEFSDGFYLDYGPLLNELGGRIWVLEPQVIEVIGNVAKANIFKVPEGYSIPVVLADENCTKASVVLNTRHLTLEKRFFADALCPGTAEPVAVKSKRDSDKLILEVPLQRGCAVIRIKNDKNKPLKIVD